MIDDGFACLMKHRQNVPPGTATSKAVDGSLNRWAALTRCPGESRLDRRQVLDRERDRIDRAGMKQYGYSPADYAPDDVAWRS